MKIILITVLSMFILTGCLEPEVEKISKEDAQKVADSLVFVKSKSGICFGVTLVSRISFNAIVAMNDLIVQVNCEDIGLQ